MILKLSVDIEKKRMEMINVGMSKGFTNEETIKISQELDDLINRSMQLQNIPYEKRETQRKASQTRELNFI
ncbi:aspartyl-phosphate phosphatase Spo0E family protein [Heyndrickxia sporothermodurans]|uniref:aspartyl-phosphate phosphatase Spo0E family protein n=1 Tax=Heyndrickxia sporothermodurans TaxID=46224 RepID=UPI000D333276|nr:aspartyl-phosphate phosphatase Spo0E family protein [Heyndrickxia sporothermodurans]PTY92345.1 hypothetical protein B5V90_03555 [Heyndrickxia sporothermodurans]